MNPVVPTPVLTSARLLLQPLSLADAPAIQAVFPRWEIVRYLAGRVPWPYPPDGAERFLREVVLPGTARGEQWHWSIRPRENAGLLIGSINLRCDGEENRGFWLDPAWHGRGLMTEASELANRFWFEALGRDVLRVSKAVANVSSRRVSERNGMRLVGQVEREFVSGVQATELWAITRDEWLAHRAEQQSGG